MFIATEIQSELRRLEQLVRWSEAKAAALPSWEGWPHLGEHVAVSRLLVVRDTRTNRDIAATFRRLLRTAYPSEPEDALAALVGDAVVARPGRCCGHHLRGVSPDGIGWSLVTETQADRAPTSSAGLGTHVFRHGCPALGCQPTRGHISRSNDPKLLYPLGSNPACGTVVRRRWLGTQHYGRDGPAGRSKTGMSRKSAWEDERRGGRRYGRAAKPPHGRVTIGRIAVSRRSGRMCGDGRAGRERGGRGDGIASHARREDLGRPRRRRGPRRAQRPRDRPPPRPRGHEPPGVHRAPRAAA